MISGERVPSSPPRSLPKSPTKQRPVNSALVSGTYSPQLRFFLSHRPQYRLQTWMFGDTSLFAFYSVRFGLYSLITGNLQGKTVKYAVFRQKTRLERQCLLGIQS